MSVFLNPPALSSSTPISTLVSDGYMPNTAVLLPATVNPPFGIVMLQSALAAIEERGVNFTSWRSSESTQATRK